ncbi:hypothetical protein T484DRAFT_1911425 [Baffinella frigidus]|nr:hypothetical protein T484DRAFT_1911425 [Cryptophyta sp. CCMP2293]
MPSSRKRRAVTLLLLLSALALPASAFSPPCLRARPPGQQGGDQEEAFTGGEELGMILTRRRLADEWMRKRLTDAKTVLPGAST